MQGGAREQSCLAICTPFCVTTKRLPTWAVCRARDDRDHGVVHSRERYFRGRVVMLGLLDPVLVGFVGPGSELQVCPKKKENMGETRQRVHASPSVGEGNFFFKLGRASYHGRPRRLPRVLPISRDREACRTLRRPP
jgi:hypothetical protein